MRIAPYVDVFNVLICQSLVAQQRRIIIGQIKQVGKLAINQYVASWNASLFLLGIIPFRTVPAPEKLWTCTVKM